MFLCLDKLSMYRVTNENLLSWIQSPYQVPLCFNEDYFSPCLARMAL